MTLSSFNQFKILVILMLRFTSNAHTAHYRVIPYCTVDWEKGEPIWIWNSISPFSSIIGPTQRKPVLNICSRQGSYLSLSDLLTFWEMTSFLCQQTEWTYSTHQPPSREEGQRKEKLTFWTLSLTILQIP